MSRCENCRKEVSDNTCHCFAGYGWYTTYCAEHCPREMDGTECSKDHPAPKDAEELRQSVLLLVKNFGGWKGLEKALEESKNWTPDIFTYEMRRKASEMIAERKMVDDDQK